MTPTHTTKGGKEYRYYACSAGQKRGHATCPSKLVPAGAAEAFVVDRVRCVGRDPALVREAVEQARAADEARLAELDGERRALEKDLRGWQADVRSLSGRLAGASADGDALARLADLDGKVRNGEARLAGVKDQAARVRRGMVDESEAAAALGRFDGVWEALTPGERARLLALLIEAVEYDGGAGSVSVTFRPAGVRALADQVAEARREKIA